MKKILTFIFSFTLLFTVGSFIFTVNAKSDNLKNMKEIKSEQINSDLIFNEYTVDSAYDPKQTFTTRNVYSYTLNPSSSTRLASWTYLSPSGYKMANLIDIAKNFEENNPGWIVLGGVNAEGYYNGELTNAFMQEGDLIRKDVSSEVFKELIGFKENGEKVIKQVPTTSSYARINVGGKKYDIKHINTVPSGNDVGVLTIDLAQTLDLTGYNVIEGSYTVYRRTKNLVETTLNGPNLGLFIKGKIVGKTNITSISNVPDRKFYIVTKDETLVNNLQDGQDIKCQFEYLDEFSDVKTMVGYMYKLIIDGESVPVDFVDTTDTGAKVIYNCDYYKTTSKQRCGIGFKENGEIVLMTSNSYRQGPTQYEFSEMLREAGCNEAYQFDGGGSVTFLKRNEFGNIEMLNTPGDGNIRSLLSGLFIVAKDPAYEQNFVESTSSKIVLDKKNLEYTNNISDYYITLNGKKYYPENDKIEITGLNDDTTYNLVATYVEDGKTYNVEFTAKTKEFKPDVTITPTINGFIIKSISRDDNFKITKMTFDIDGFIYDSTDETLIIDDLDKNMEYGISYICNYENVNTKEALQKTYESKTYSTLPFVIPSVDTFMLSKATSSRVVFEYKYLDPDSVVDEAYVVFNGTKYDLDVKFGKLTIRDLALTSGEYDAVLYLKYKDKTGRLKVVTSDTIKVEIEHVHDFTDATCTAPRTCKTCQYQEGAPLGHDAKDATCTEASVCSRCNEVLQEALGHDWMPADYEKPKTCKRCNQTEGEPLKKEDSKPKNKCKKASITQLMMTLIPLCGLILIRRKRG